ncbi:MULTISPECIES: DUF3085 domain-containing protein [unclassified Mesorhizobium]|uniref:DUF3085 domain-containing protein n=1 Tax=unclassified Mesorhizobium TaxID=325217 RepID=UPI000FD92DCB|nr:MULTISPECIES: DUF3085 domain-containing protein [unclassified Mesorhizobium]TGQ04920.1 DUF3085 domain-containing protein [Mesorhizobium sp. M2E.F.Ca.ET.219.01.1.1]TGT65638.1 DUF3085 domain-containing protein [Mesorhizobium sp. M2E.F.Ca.ET.166.01.1.1]TGV97683.1 DUF3085 domain-containing protein [Mesorhizobium sp. M2E.F.Ca.ET.154.01.1.1]
MFTFPIVAVRKVIDRGIADAAVNRGFRNPYYGTRPGEGEKSGLWLVGDQGVYIMSNGKLAEGSRALVVYAEQCHPKGDFDWWDYKRRHFGADDGIEFIEAERLIPLVDRNYGATHLNVELTETDIALSLITR